jgi:predicted DNA-binding protein (UPF0251 family)
MNPITAAERSQAVALYQTGLTLAQVGNRMNRSAYAVRCALVAAGIPRRSANQSTITAAERAEVVRLYTVEKLSTYAIAERLSRAQSTIWTILTEAGVSMRPVGWPSDAATRWRNR